MDELIQQISARTGLSAEQSRSAAEAVLHFLKERLPAPIAGHLDGLLGSSGSAETTSAEGGTANENSDGLLGTLEHGLGGLLGGGQK